MDLISVEFQEKFESDIQACLTGQAVIEKVETKEQYENLWKLHQQATKLWRSGEQERKRIKKPHLDNGIKVDDYFKENLNPLSDFGDNVKSVLQDYDKTQEVKRIENQKKADIEARKERDKLDNQIDKAKANGQVEKVEALEQKAESVVSTVVESEKPKVKGKSDTVKYKFRIKDERAFMTHCIAEKSFCFILINESSLRKEVEIKKQDFSMPGIEVYTKIQTGTRVK